MALDLKLAIKHGKRSSMENGQIWKTVKYENGLWFKLDQQLAPGSQFGMPSISWYLSINITFVYFWSQFLFWSLFHFRSRPHFIGNQILPPFTPSISAPPITSRYRRSLPILEKKHENPFLYLFCRKQLSDCQITNSADSTSGKWIFDKIFLIHLSLKDSI